jgi:hypothetical protein
MPKARKILSDSELIAYSKQHVQYEIAMLLGCQQLLMRSFESSSQNLKVVLRNVLVESFAIHLRNLVDFLYPGPNIKSTDVLADDFFPHGKRPVAFPSLPHDLETARKHAHKQVSHLTTGRLNEGDPGKNWPTFALTQKILDVLGEFVRQASPDKLDSSLRDYVLALPQQIAT